MQKASSPWEGDALSANVPLPGLAPSLLTLRPPQGTMKPPNGDLGHNHAPAAATGRVHRSLDTALERGGTAETGRAPAVFPSPGSTPSAGDPNSPAAIRAA